MDIPTRPSRLVVGELDLLRIHRLAAHLHRLGARPTGELLTELAAGPIGPVPVLATLERYRLLTPQQVVAAGADRMVPRHLVLVP
jgi:hypothetical protein